MSAETRHSIPQVLCRQDALLQPDGSPKAVPSVALSPPHRLTPSPREAKLLEHFAADIARCGAPNGI